MVWTLGERLRRRADRRPPLEDGPELAQLVCLSGPPLNRRKRSAPKDLWGGSRAEAVRAANSYHHKRSRPAPRVHASDRAAIHC